MFNIACNQERLNGNTLYVWAIFGISVHLQSQTQMLLDASKNDPRYEISNNVICATIKASDQTAQMRSLIEAFASRLNIL